MRKTPEQCVEESHRISQETWAKIISDVEALRPKADRAAVVQIAPTVSIWQRLWCVLNGGHYMTRYTRNRNRWGQSICHSCGYRTHGFPITVRGASDGV